MLKDKKHSKPTPPKEKPGWLRKGIASLAALYFVKSVFRV